MGHLVFVHWVRLEFLWIRSLDALLEIHPAFLLLEFRFRWCRTGDLKGEACWLAGYVS